MGRLSAAHPPGCVAPYKQGIRPAGPGPSNGSSRRATPRSSSWGFKN